MGLFDKNKKKQTTTVRCFVCQHEWEFNDTSIPEGATYELMCPQCKTLLKRKKTNQKQAG